MQRFKFRLARLEKLRELRRREARIALARAVAARNALRERRAEAEGRYQQAVYTELSDGPHDISEWRELIGSRERARMQLAAAETAEAEAQPELDQAEAAYAEASRKHRALERLREKRHARWREEEKQEEQKFLDENFLLRSR